MFKTCNKLQWRFLKLNNRNFQKLHNRPDFTKNVYNVERGPYNVLAQSHLEFFNSLLGNNRVVTDLSDLERYNVDWLKRYRGSSSIVLKPKTVEEVSQLLSFCNANKLAVCPQGGNTGMAGSVPVCDEIIISTELINKIINFDDNSSVLVCEAGCVLENLNTYISKYNSLVPLDLGSRGSCQIGGNVSTNAGGLRLLRYGNLHGNVLGLEVVKANGEVVDCMSTLKKDNTGYHLKNIFIGSEGTLGIITKVAIQCTPKCKSLGLAFLGLESYENVLNTFRSAKYTLGEILSAVEVIDGVTMNLVKEYLHLESPIGEYPYYLMVETSGSNEEHDGEKLNDFLEQCLANKHILNGTVTTEPTKYQAMWNIRERIPEVFRDHGFPYLYDFTLPLTHFYTIVDEMREYMGKNCDYVSGFGHLGDGNLHLQIILPKYSEEMQKLIEPYVFTLVKKYNGSISAEHGIGFSKAKYLALVKNPESMNLMKNLKNLMDPNGILNPYKVLV